MAGILAWLLLALLCHALWPGGTYHDEAYYWTWSRRPLAWGYFSKPPMIAWLGAISTTLFGPSVLGVRAWAFTLMAATALLGGKFAYETTRKPAAFAMTAGLLLLMVNPVADTNKIQAFFWILTLYAVWRAVENAPRFWILAGAAIGLGILGRHTHVFLLPVIAIFITWHAREHLRRPEFWGGLAVMVTILMPHLVWLWKHDAATVRHTVGLGANDESAPTATASAWDAALQFMAGQMSITGVVGVFALVAALAWAILRTERSRHRQLIHLLLIAWAIPFAFYASMLPFREVLDHWFMPVYLPLTVVAGIWAGSADTRWRTSASAAFMVMGFLFASFMMLINTGLSGPEGTPPNGPAFSKSLERALDETGADFVFSYGNHPRFMAWAEFYLPGQLLSRSLYLGEIASQYDLWQDAWEGSEGQDGILIVPGPEDTARGRIEALVAEGFFDSGEYLETMVLDDDWQVSLCIMRGYTGKQLPMPNDAPISTRFAATDPGPAPAG